MNPYRKPDRHALADLIFLGFNSRIAALHRDSGEIVWQWKSPKGSGYVAFLLENDRLFASLDGYLYCLNPQSGEQLWANPMKGMGTGVPSLISVNGLPSGASGAYATIAQQQQAQHNAATT